jgi:hypothetical protein
MNTVNSANHHKPPLVSSQSMIVPSSVKQQGAASVFSTFTPAAHKDSTHQHSSSQYSLVPNQYDPVKTTAKYQAVPVRENNKSAVDQDASLKHPVSNRRSLVLDQRHLRATSDPKTLQEMVRAGSDVVPSLPPKTKYQASPSAAPSLAPKPPSFSTDSLARFLSTPNADVLRQFPGPAGFSAGVVRPQPPPRKVARVRPRRCKALFDCEADHPGE